MRRFPMLAASLTAFLVQTHSVADDWPCFQGPDRSGVVAGTDWSSEGAAEPLWTAEVGMGYSCPSIVGGRLVTMGYDEAAGLDHVLCLDAMSGAEIWRTSYEASDAPNYHTGGTLTTPAIHGGVVHVANREGKAHALDLDDGAVVWERDYRAELDLAETFHGYCASPLVLDDRILLSFGGVAAAVKRDGGDLIWRTTDYGDGAYSNHAVVETRGRRGMAVMLAQTFLVLDVADGSTLHELPWPLQGSAVHVATPLVMGDLVFLSTAYNKGCALMRLGEAVAPETLWSNKRMRNKVTGCFRHGDHIYGFDESMLKCVDLEGNEAWRVRGLGMGTLSIAGDRLLVLSSKGELIVADATADGFRERSRQKVLSGGVYWTMPVLVDGLVYVRNSEGRMACLDHRGDGAVAVTVETTDATPAVPAAPPAADLFAAHDHVVGGEQLRKQAGMRLSGTWEIRARGLAPEPMTLTLVAPDRWRQDLDEGGLTYAYDGEFAWADEPRGVFVLEGDEGFEAPMLFGLHATLAPRCPADARVEPAPVRFEGSACWRVVSSIPGPDGIGARAVSHYFDVESGRLAGREGEGISRLVFDGTLEHDGVRVPGRITQFRVGSGQEETMEFTACAWLDETEARIERTPGVERLLRTPAAIEAANEALRERFADALGRYRVDVPLLPGDVMEILVENGDLLSSIGNDTRRIEIESEEGGQYVVRGTGGSTIEFVRDEHGAITGIRLRLRGPDGFDEFLLPQIE